MAEDPWNSGDWETHVIVSDGTAIVEARWSRPAEIHLSAQMLSLLAKLWNSKEIST